MNVHQTHVKMVRHALMESMDTHALVLGQAIQVLLRCRVYLSLMSRNLCRLKRKLCCFDFLGPGMGTMIIAFGS